MHELTAQSPATNCQEEEDSGAASRTSVDKRIRSKSQNLKIVICSIRYKLIKVDQSVEVGQENSFFPLPNIKNQAKQASNRLSSLLCQRSFCMCQCGHLAPILFMFPDMLHSPGFNFKHYNFQKQLRFQFKTGIGFSKIFFVHLFFVHFR